MRGMDGLSLAGGLVATAEDGQLLHRESEDRKPCRN
jgi:hypothetical protein